MNFEWLTGVDARWGTGLLSLAFVGLVVWAFVRAPVEREARGTWRDLRWWVLGLVVAQLALYWMF